MEIKLYKSELKILNILWENGDIPAKQIVKIANKKIGWNKSTTYTIIKRCIEKGIIENKGDDFICHALISKEDSQKYETIELIKNMYDGSTYKLIISLLSNALFNKNEIEKIKNIILTFV